MTNDQPPPASTRLQGVGASPGAAVGPVFRVDRRREQGPRRRLARREVEAEVARLQDAIALSEQQLAEIRGHVPKTAAEHALILDAHRLMLHDPAFTGTAIDLIRTERVNAEWAVRRVVGELAVNFNNIDDPYFRERRGDLEYVGDRIVRNLMGIRTDVFEARPENAILVSRDLSPADLVLLLKGRRVAGIVTEVGGPTSHTAIIARALEIPAVLAAPKVSELVAAGDSIALDGGAGVVVIRPDDRTRQAFLDIRQRYERQEKEDLATASLESRTTDGHRITLRANIELFEELPGSISHGAEGIGLYRTEFLYLNREDLPSEDEHYEVYRRLLESLPTQPVTIRTLDLGGDKQLPGNKRGEANPAMGLRGIRFCLARPDLFLPQLRALWRASVHGELRVMFPLISDVEEFRQARTLFQQTRDDVIREGHPVADSIPLGVMIETPGAALIADRLARECAFLAIGTNDLIQYSLAIDRRNRDVAYLYNPLHPSILQILKTVLDAADAQGIEVSICGEMAGDPRYTLILMALGARELSMTGTAVPEVKRLIRSTSLAEAQELLAEVERLETGAEIDRFVNEWMQNRFPETRGHPAAREQTSPASTGGPNHEPS